MGLTKATLTNTVSGERFPVLFNPEEYTLAKDVTWAQAAVPGLNGPLLQFVNGGARTLDMELLLDTYEAHRDGGRELNRAGQDVRDLSRRITGLMEVDPATHAPPVLLFTWASLSFTCVLTRASERFLMFLPDGTPVRVRLQVTLTEFRSAEREAKEVKRETADHTREVVLGEGEALASVAQRAYGDPALWRVVAIHNRIEDPRRPPAGLRLELPPLPYRDPASGITFPEPAGAGA